jgi:hypothetical protein
MPKSKDLEYGQRKRRREVMVTDQGWEMFKARAAALGLSASELVERLGRGLVASDLNLELTGKRCAS